MKAIYIIFYYIHYYTEMSPAMAWVKLAGCPSQDHPQQ